MSSEPVLRVQHVSKCFEIYEKPVHRLFQMICAGRHRFYREFWALRDVSLEVRKGECIGIVGRNGAGKSTLLQIIAGVLRPTDGTVERSGRIAALLELGSGFNPEFTGRENVSLNASILGLSPKELDEKYHEIASFADIGDFMDQPVKTYSTGMMLRLAFAVQVISEPDILIVDEALAVGDIFFQQKCFAHLRKLVGQGTTVLFVSHDTAMIRSFCDRALYLKQGRPAAAGSARDIVEMYQNDTTASGAPSFSADASAVVRTEPAGTPDWYREDPDLDRKITERSGSGEIRLAALDFYDRDGRRISECFLDDEVRIVMSLRVCGDVPAGAQIGLLCRDERGIDVFTTNLVNDSLFLPELKAGQRVAVSWRFRIPVFGTFFFSMGIKPDMIAPLFYDRPFNAASLRTIRRDPNDITCALLRISPSDFRIDVK